MKRKIRIRAAQLPDRDRMRVMWRALALHQAGVDGRLELADDFMTRWEADFQPWVQSNVHLMLVAQEGLDAHNLVGFLHARRYEHAPVFRNAVEVFVEALWVDKAMRRSGVASQLVDGASEWAQRIGSSRLRYSVISRDASAVAFWLRQGGEPLIQYGTVKVSPVDRAAKSDDDVDAGRPALGFRSGG